jgi:hypothetical protein
MIRTALIALSLAMVTPSVAVGQATDGSWQTDFSKHTVPLEEIVSGGPPKDGIPAIDRPQFVDVSSADRWLEDREPVVLLAINGAAKAYPLQILIWHEIVNDAVGGVPVSITFCPLCNTALAFDRRHDGRTLDFGTTGRLRHSDLVMYDRQTETWWQQATGEGIVGDYAGARLTFISAPLVNWRTFKERYPDGQVLSRETGHSRPYGRNPYQGYDDVRSSPIARFFRGRTDDRLPAMERVAAVELGDESVAYPFRALRMSRVMNKEVGGMPLVIMWAPGTASALDDREIADGRDVGTTGVFRRTVDGRTLTFERAGDGRYRDRQTESVWNILGEAISGPLAGTHMEAVPHGNHFWFAWAAFKPETKIVR